MMAALKSTCRQFCYSLLIPAIQKHYVWKLKRKDTIKVVFIAMKVAIWKYQALYELFERDKRFKVFVVLSPSIKYSYEEQCKDMENMRNYFKSKHIHYIDWDIENGKEAVDIKKSINPDILFYPQPYDTILVPQHRFVRFWNKLLCYYPYAFWMIAEDWGYNLRFHNIAWRLFYGTQYNLEDAKRLSYNKGRNVRVVGYPDSDILLSKADKDVWKIKDRNIKRIIWAPHFTFFSVLKGVAPRSNFLWMAEAMFEIAKKYQGELQIAFKPHPRLLTELYKHPLWGKEKADSYYQKWKDLDNGQVELEEYFDLFKTSDALIHDCGSFSADYLYLNKPVMFISQDIDCLKNTLNDLGKSIYDNHYIGKTREDVENFLYNIVLKGEDYMKSQREDFLKNYLLPKAEKYVSVAQNTYNEVLHSLNFA